MTLTQLTHHDLDGYGASTVAHVRAGPERVVHVSRYADVGPVVAQELARLSRADAPETLLMTDLGLEAPAVEFIRNVVALNARRGDGRHHRLVVLDHHASSLDQLKAGGFGQEAPRSPAWPGLRSIATGDPDVLVLIDDTRCATRLAYDHADLYGAGAPDGASDQDLALLVEAIDAVDLWRKDRPVFRLGQALDDVFWDSVSAYVPVAHPWHDRFMGALLLGMAALLRQGATPAAIEREAGSLRARVVDGLLAGTPGDDPDATTRMRLAPRLAESPALFARLKTGARLSFGLDPGMFQRVSDALMARGETTLVINVGRSGSMSFRSNDGTALDAARRFRGGGHRDAAGGRLASGGASSLADAVDQVSAVLDAAEAAIKDGPFAALRGFKA